MVREGDLDEGACRDSLLREERELVLYIFVVDELVVCSESAACDGAWCSLIGDSTIHTFDVVSL